MKCRNHTPLRLPSLIVCLVILAVLLVEPASAELAPDFSLVRLDGGRIRLEELLNKTPVLLHFFDTCCPGCREALPSVTSAGKQLGDSLLLIGIATDSPKSQSKIKPFLKTNRYNLLIGLDPDLETRKLFGGTDSPYTVLVSPNGEILLRQIGDTPDLTNNILNKVRQSYQTPLEIPTTSPEHP